MGEMWHSPRVEAVTPPKSTTGLERLPRIRPADRQWNGAQGFAHQMCSRLTSAEDGQFI